VVTRLLPHTADLSVEVEAPTKQALFSEFARALTDLMVEGEVQPSRQETVALSAMDLPSLLVGFLNELIFLWEDQSFLAGDIRFTEWKRFTFQAVVLGESFSPDRHRLMHGVKAATYHDLQLARIGRIWRGQVLFDV
jgi:SHS2 domain-containing protein